MQYLVISLAFSPLDLKAREIIRYCRGIIVTKNMKRRAGF